MNKENNLTATTVLVNALSAERHQLAQAARLHWFHWVIIVLSGILTVFAWQFAVSQVKANAAAQFDRESSQVVDLVTERMQRYEDALWSGVAAIEASGGDMTHTQWHAFSASLHIDSKYPGINGIGVIKRVTKEQLAEHLAAEQLERPGYRVHPEHSGSEFMPIVFIEPEEPNAKAVGLDMAHEANRYTAAKMARDSGVAQITGPIVLVQDEGHTPGFLFYAPYFKNTAAETTVERRDSFVGMVYAPFVVKRLLAGTLEKERRRVGIRLSDDEQPIYDEHIATEADFDPAPMFSRSVDLDIYGRTWRFDIRSTKSFRQMTASNQPIWILIGGIAIDGLLLFLFVSISKASRRALHFADRMNTELRRKALALKRSNSELESFAYIASHDLKTPIRGIADLASYLEEDIQPHAADPNFNPDISRNLKRIVVQTQRMEDLIAGILDYSSVGRREEPVERVDVADIVASIRTVLDVSDKQLIIDGPLPILNTKRVRLEQVLGNLIGNAFKFHHDRDKALVTVSCQNKGDFVEISVSDNGPGIDAKFHARVFEVFQSLQSKDKIEGSGVGLSIVKKSVEALGGDISLSSAPGEGAVFRFSWPRAA